MDGLLSFFATDTGDKILWPVGMLAPHSADASQLSVRCDCKVSVECDRGHFSINYPKFLVQIFEGGFLFASSNSRARECPPPRLYSFWSYGTPHLSLPWHNACCTAVAACSCARRANTGKEEEEEEEAVVRALIFGFVRS